MRSLAHCLLLSLAVCYSIQAQTNIKGRIVSAEGGVLKAAHVHLAYSDALAPFLSAAADSNGRFELYPAEEGLLRLQFTGVGHRKVSAAILLEAGDSIRVEVSLERWRVSESPSSLRLIGDFNNFSLAAARRMDAGDDRCFQAQFERSADTIAYQIVHELPGADGRAGSLKLADERAARFVYDGADAYYSVADAAADTVTIQYCPPDDASTVEASSVLFAAPIRKEFQAMIRAMEQGRTVLAADDRIVDGQIDLIAALEQEWRLPMRQTLLLAALQSLAQHAGAEDTLLLMSAFAELEPTSPLWAYQPSLLHSPTLRVLRPDYYEAYLHTAMHEHPSSELRAFLLYDALKSADQAEQQQYFYDRLSAQHPESPYARLARAAYAPDRMIMPGKALPDFSCDLLDSAGTTFSPENMRGRYLLLNFWATWCKPCVDEMPRLHALYKESRRSELEILSLSFDRRESDIVKFRRKYWHMPWLHTLLAAGRKSKLAQLMEVQSLPKTILVDPNGLILAVGTSLLDTSFIQKLEQVIAADAQK